MYQAALRLAFHNLLDGLTLLSRATRIITITISGSACRQVLISNALKST